MVGMTLSLPESYAYCAALAKRTAGNFYYSFLTLPKDRFRAMCALYAFMRVTDDWGDSAESVEVRTRDLAAWRRDLSHALEGQSREHPVLPAVADMVRRYAIPPEHLRAVIDGVEMDLGPVRIETFGQLEKYCYHVAGAVGLACIHLWGFHDTRALAAAVDCGTAFQLTNILRDLREDALMGRVYLPAEDLRQFGCTADDFAKGRMTSNFLQLMQFEVARAREYYARAEALHAYLDPPGRPILETMISIYGGLLDEIERREYDVFTERVRLSGWRKLSMAGRAIVKHKLRRLFTRA